MTTKPKRAPLSSGVVFNETAVTKISNAKQRAERNGKVMMPFWVPLSARIQLRVTAAEEDTTQQELMIEGLNHVFKSRGKPPIA